MAELIEKACKLCHICARMKLSARGSLVRRMNSAPSPMSLMLGDATGKESSLLLPAASPMSLALAEAAGKENVLALPHTRSPAKVRALLDEEQDSNSQDSGCAEEPNADIRFAIPSGFAPRKNIEPSPGKMWHEEISSPSGPRRILTGSRSPGSPSTMRSPSSLRSPSTMRSPSTVRSPSTTRNPLRSLSFCSTDSFDDGFSELPEVDKPDGSAPSALASLLTGQLIGGKENDKSEEMLTPTAHRHPLRRAFSMVENQLNTPTSSNEGKMAYKRPRELGVGGGLMKKIKGDAPRHKLQRSVSETAATVLSSTLSNLYGRPELIADFSRPYALPVVAGKHTDLTTITADTLASVMRGEFASSVRSYRIIDCRFPYEFEGGHIRGAENLYTCEQVETTLLGSGVSSAGSGNAAARDILIFHCEFSVARGPSMYRWLRRLDRNNSTYPSLQYPEVYLLHGGYQVFHESHATLCEPTGYRPMQEPGYETDLRKFRAKSSSWSVSRASFKRLQLL